MNVKLEELNRALSQVLYRSQEITNHAQMLRSTPLFVDWETAWKYSYRVETDLRLLAGHLLDVNTRLVDMRVEALGLNSLPLDVVGDVLTKTLRSFLGLSGPLYEQIYASLGETVYSEESPEAAQLAEAIQAQLEENSPTLKDDLPVFSAVLNALAFRADPTLDRQRDFLGAFKELLVKRIDKTSVVLELLSELSK